MRIWIAIGLCLTLMACGSRLNPLNWFGGAREEAIAVEEIEETVPQDGRPLVEEIVSLSIDPLPSGAVITVTGLPPRQGFWEADLVLVDQENGRITYDFRLIAPEGDTATGTAVSREVIVATDLSNQDLAGIREIAVRGRVNQLVSRR